MAIHSLYRQPVRETRVGARSAILPKAEFQENTTRIVGDFENENISIREKA